MQTLIFVGYSSPFTHSSFPPSPFICVCVVIAFLLWHFIRIFTVCQSTHLGVTKIQRVINDSLRMTQDEELFINVYYCFIHFLIYNLQSNFSHILYSQQFIFSLKYFHMITNILHRYYNNEHDPFTNQCRPFYSQSTHKFGIHTVCKEQFKTCPHSLPSPRLRG